MRIKDYLRRKLSTISVCPLCGEHTTESNPITTDHIWPKSKGGINHRINYRFICLNCNISKGDRYPSIPELKGLYGATIAALKKLIKANDYGKEYKDILKFKRKLFKWSLKKDTEVVV